MRIVVNTPTGHIGHLTARTLLEAGHEVVLIARNPEKVKDLVALGGSVVQGSIDDPATLDKAFMGADSLFWLTPPAYQPDYNNWAEKTAKLAVDRANAHGIRRAVVISSMGAHVGQGVGPVTALLPVENAFRSRLPNVATLRPGMFMENLYRDLDSIVKNGAVFAPLSPNQKLTWVATGDIAATATRYLLTDQWQGHLIEGVHGPADLTYPEVLSELSTLVGKPLNFVQVTPDQARGAMLGMGMPEFLVNTFLEMYTAIADGRMLPAEPRTPQTTTPTSIRTFLRNELLPAYRAAAQR